MKRADSHSSADNCKTRLEQAEVRVEQAEMRTEQAKTRAEAAETRTEQAEARTDLAKTCSEQAEIRTEQAETQTEQANTTLQRVLGREVDLIEEMSTRLPKKLPLNQTTDEKNPLNRLTSRQREILRLIAEGQNTKQIAHILKVSPKTVEYHRLKLMHRLNLYDVPSLVRFALRAGLISE